MRKVLQASGSLHTGSGGRSATDARLMVTTVAPGTAYKPIIQLNGMRYCKCYHIVIPEPTYWPFLRLNSTRIINTVSRPMAKYHAIQGARHIRRAKAGISRVVAS